MIDGWEVYIKANVLETTEKTIKNALCACDVTEEHEEYITIRPRTMIEAGDYIDNITWVGTLAKTGKPVIVQVFNAINTDGLKVTTQDKNEAVSAMSFYGHYTKSDEVPFAIHYPKGE